MAKRYERLSRQLFNIFPSPLLRAQFLRDGRWILQSLAPIAAKDIPRSHRSFVAEAASLHFAGRGTRRRSRTPHRWDLAILVRPDDPEPPSDARALKRFARAAEDLGLRPTFIEKQDQGRLAEFDALFIRETTYVNHHTYRFAAKAETEGLVVMDDPGSIIRCTNKVYLEEALRRRDVPRPRTLIVHSGNVEDVIDSLGLPCVLKRPDSSFSAGVVRVDSEDELRIEVQRMLRESELVVAQEYARTNWDWRVGVLDRKPLYACRYGMAPGHWQVINRQVDDDDDARYGDFETVRIEDAPPALIRMALRAAEVMGDSLYGVDLKEIAGRFIVMEVNDNPNIDSGVEDAVLGDELYARVMRVFLERIERRGTRSPVASTPRQAGEAP